VAGRSARRGDGQGGAGARRRALPARVWRTAARCGLSVWRHHHRESVVGRPEGAQPPNTAGGNTTRGETAHGGTPPANTHKWLNRVNPAPKASRGRYSALELKPLEGGGVRVNPSMYRYINKDIKTYIYIYL